MKLKSLIAVGALCLTVGSSAMAEELSRHFVKLSGFQETPPILTTGSGTFKWALDRTGTSLTYTLTFTGLSSAATVSHIHFGQPGGAGAPIAFLCGGTKPACPADVTGTVTGTIIASDIQGVPAQGVNAGSFTDFLAVLRSGDAYVNVHTTAHTGGEVRGQIKKSHFD